MNHDSRLTPDLQHEADRLAAVAREYGLDFFETSFELIDYNQLAEIAAYGGFPTRYPHWRFGMEYERIAKSYTYGLSIIYEMVINTNPCYAYLLRANNMVYQKTVIAHVYGHCDFFKNNIWFSKTNRKMLDQMANHATVVKRHIDAIGQDEVESFIDCALSLENLIDPYLPFQTKPSNKANTESPDGKMPAKNYMDSYINPKDLIASQKKERDNAQIKPLKHTGNRDILLFLIENAPLPEWKRQILNIIRDEAYYFVPQMQTKILNEGWATYWHSLMMTNYAKLDASEIVDYCDHYAGVVASSPTQLNPYKLGVELLRHIERRWDKGRFGLDYYNCDDPLVRSRWDTQAGLGRKKLFEVRSLHNDISFIDDFLDEDFCHENKMFIYDFDPKTRKYTLSSRDFPAIKRQLLAQLTNFGQPLITIKDDNYRNRGELLIQHHIDPAVKTEDLKRDYLEHCLTNMYRIWSRPVHIETVVDGAPKRVTYNGEKHEVEKVA